MSREYSDTTNEGTAIAPTVITPVNLSKKLFRCTAEKQPSTVPSSADHPMAAMTRAAVWGNCSAMIRVTARWLKTSSPRSPRIAFAKKTTYCTCMGWSRPILAR